MNLFGELLFASDHPNLRRFDAGESQPIPALDRFQRMHNNVTNAGVQVESGKGSFVPSNFDGIAGTAVARQSNPRRAVRSHTRTNQREGC